MAKCAYCHRAKGKRTCPALGGLICARCCGEHRLVRIACPADCVYLTTHEGYQRERTAEAFLEERARLLSGLRNRKAATFLSVLEMILYRHFGLRPTALDGELIAALEETRRRLSPILLSESARTPSGEAIFKELEPFLKELDRSAAADAVEGYLRWAQSFSGAALRSHRLLRGLKGFMEQHHPGLAEPLQKEASSKRIVPA